jgi:hypothetical protein
MKLGISIKIDVTKIDKSRIFEGKKGKYIDLSTFIDLDQEDEYGNNGFISQSVSKQEREQGVQTPILGNCRVFYKDGGQQQSHNENYGQGVKPNTQGQANYQGGGDFEDDSIPF